MLLLKISWQCQLIALWAPFQNGNSVTASVWVDSLHLLGITKIYSPLIQSPVSECLFSRGIWTTGSTLPASLVTSKSFLSPNEPAFSKIHNLECGEKLALCVAIKASSQLNVSTLVLRRYKLLLFASCYYHRTNCSVRRHRKHPPEFSHHVDDLSGFWKYPPWYLDHSLVL